jgi:hypothetical protein
MIHANWPLAFRRKPFCTVTEIRAVESPRPLSGFVTCLSGSYMKGCQDPVDCFCDICLRECGDINSHAGSKPLPPSTRGVFV